MVGDDDAAPTTTSLTCSEALKARAPKWKLQLACMLAVAQGWASMECLLIYQTFASIMTGNILMVASGCIGGDGQGCAVHVSVLFSYAFGFLLYRGVTLTLGFYTSSTALATVVALLLFAIGPGCHVHIET